MLYPQKPLLLTSTAEFREHLRSPQPPSSWAEVNELHLYSPSLRAAIQGASENPMAFVFWSKDERNVVLAKMKRGTAERTCRV